MQRYQIIIATSLGTLSAIAIGYFGVQIFGKNMMSVLGNGMFGFGAGACVAQVVVNRRRQLRMRSKN